RPWKPRSFTSRCGMGHTWSTAGHVRGTAYLPSPRGVPPRQSGATSALTPWVIPRVMPQRVHHWAKKPAALVALAGAEATRATPAPAFYPHPANLARSIYHIL